MKILFLDRLKPGATLEKCHMEAIPLGAFADWELLFAPGDR